MAITPAEYVERLSRLVDLIAARDLTAYLVADKHNIYYLTGLTYEPEERPFFLIVRPGAPTGLLVPALELDHLQGAPNVDWVHHYWDYPSPPGQGWPERLEEELAGITRLGLEPSLPAEILRQLGDFQVEVLPLVETLRLVKSPAEVAMIEQAARFADLGVARVIGAAYHGVSELELFAQGRNVQLQIMKEVGYEPLTTNVLVAAWPAPLSAQPHGVPAIADRLENGPHIALSYLRVNGYAAECERTFFLSEPTSQEREVFEAVMEARRRALQKIQPGVEAAAVDLAAKDFLIAQGYGQYLLHRTGHGFGLGNHEGPWVAEGSTDILQQNMLVSVEPGAYLPGVGGFRHSDTVLVTLDGPRFLTSFPDKLEDLVIRPKKRLGRIKGRLIRRAAGIG
jgi:Xaa-Pro aminopeptidase